MNDKSGEYGKNFMKIKFNPDVNLPLNKILKLHASLIAWSVFEEDDPDVFLDECLYGLWMLEYDRIDISEGIYFNKTKEIKKNVIYIIICIFRQGF